MKFEVKRKIDSLGRLVIPKAIRDFYRIKKGDTIVLLTARDGILISSADLFITNDLPQNSTATVDEMGRFVIPDAFRKEYGFVSQDTLRIVPNETCMLIYKNNSTVNTDETVA